MDALDGNDLLRRKEVTSMLTSEQKTAIRKWCLNVDRAKGILEDCDEFRDVTNFGETREEICAYIESLESVIERLENSATRPVENI